jgi:hypothetical protein
MDPIKPKQLLMMKPDFKKEKLGDNLHKHVLHGLYGQFEFNQDGYINLSSDDIEDLSRRLQQAVRVPPHYFNVNPIGVSSRQIQNIDRPIDLLGGEQMMYGSTTTMVLSSPRKKKTFIGKVKQFFLDIYKRWKI